MPCRGYTAEDTPHQGAPPLAIDVAAMSDLDDKNFQNIVPDLADQAKVANAVAPQTALLDDPALLERRIKSVRYWSSRRLDIGQREIVALEQQGFVGRLGKRIGKAVTEVEPGLVAALAEIQKRLAGERALFKRNRFNDHAGATDEDIDLPRRIRPGLALDHHRELQETGHAQMASVGILDQLSEPFLFRFAVENGDESRGVEYHFGSPFSSYSTSP